MLRREVGKVKIPPFLQKPQKGWGTQEEAESKSPPSLQEPQKGWATQRTIDKDGPATGVRAGREVGPGAPRGTSRHNGTVRRLTAQAPPSRITKREILGEFARNRYAIRT